ncbi:MAG: ATP synthase F0 subunit B [Pseudomonadota bacterium]
MPDPVKTAIRTALLSAFVLLAGLAGPCLAAGASAPWRGTYDTVMMWINFVILVAVLVKVLRKPLGEFLDNQRVALTKEIDQLTKQKEQAEADISAFREKMDARKERFDAIHQNIVDSGEKERQELIADAHQQAGILIESAHQRIANQLRKADKALRAELIDAAMATATAQLPSRITSENTRNWIDRFIHDIDASAL